MEYRVLFLGKKGELAFQAGERAQTEAGTEMREECRIQELCVPESSLISVCLS